MITAAAIWVTLGAPAQAGDAAHPSSSARPPSPSVAPPADLSAQRITERLRRAPPANSKREPRRVPRDQFERALRQKLKSVLDARSVPALGAAYFSPDQPLAFAVVGKRKWDAQPKALPTDAFHVGSNTKAMTATLVGLYVDRGYLKWTTTIEELFPEWSRQAGNSMLYHAKMEDFIGQCAGVGQPTSEQRGMLLDPKLSEREQRYAYTRSIVTSRVPVNSGTYEYSNSNYIIIGAMLEQRFNKTWEELIQKDLFDPLGMKSAGFGIPGAIGKIEAPWGHQNHSDQLEPNQWDNPPALGPAGTVHVNLEDYMRFLRLHVNGSEGRVSLSPATLTKLHTPLAGRQNDGKPNEYGGGWIVDTTSSSETRLGHEGSNRSWLISSWIIPSRKTAFAVVSNLGMNEEPGLVTHDAYAALWDVLGYLFEQ